VGEWKDGRTEGRKDRRWRKEDRKAKEGEGIQVKEGRKDGKKEEVKE
jgi:hypothetical protein